MTDSVSQFEEPEQLLARTTARYTTSETKVRIQCEWVQCKHLTGGGERTLAALLCPGAAAAAEAGICSLLSNNKLKK